MRFGRLLGLDRRGGKKTKRKVGTDRQERE